MCFSKYVPDAAPPEGLICLNPILRVSVRSALLCSSQTPVFKTASQDDVVILFFTFSPAPLIFENQRILPFP